MQRRLLTLDSVEISLDSLQARVEILNANVLEELCRLGNDCVLFDGTPKHVSNAIVEDGYDFVAFVRDTLPIMQEMVRKEEAYQARRQRRNNRRRF
jgi:hypothetical protein